MFHRQTFLSLPVESQDKTREPTWSSFKMSTGAECLSKVHVQAPARQRSQNYIMSLACMNEVIMFTCYKIPHKNAIVFQSIDNARPLARNGEGAGVTTRFPLLEES